MIKSMTGFGKAEINLENKKVTIEVKSLNSKQVDLNVRTPSVYREKELQVRKMISKQLIRGKMDCSMYVEVTGDLAASKINTDLLQNYHEQLQSIDFLAKDTTSDFLSILMRMPDVMKNERPTLDETEWVEIEKTIQLAVDQLNEFRDQEGEALAKDLSQRVNRISDLLAQVEPLEEPRIAKIKDRIRANVEELADKVSVDENRLEQEIIFYLEKLDVTEEKVRLRNHCTYFLDTMNAEAGQGKKLGFICQEMGREINTLGSKANDTDIQKLVVNMKDELEKIKEQILNVL